MNTTRPQSHSEPTTAQRTNKDGSPRKKSGPKFKLGPKIDPLAESRLPKTKRQKRIIDAPDVVDLEPERRDVYFGPLAQRLIQYIKRRIKHDRGRFNYHARLSWANLSRATGIPYNTLMSYFVRQHRRLTLEMLDKTLIVFKISILDLLDHVEILSFIQSMPEEERATFRISMKRFLDKLDEQAHTGSDSDGSRDSQ